MAALAELVDRARAAYEALVVLGEEIDDEWQYISDLSEVWLAELDRVVAERGAEPAPVEAEAAIDSLIGEIGRISDPHRAIDWLSTFPQAALLALEPRG
jgi:hypothetical protein